MHVSHFRDNRAVFALRHHAARYEPWTVAPYLYKTEYELYPHNNMRVVAQPENR